MDEAVEKRGHMEFVGDVIYERKNELDAVDVPQSVLKYRHTILCVFYVRSGNRTGTCQPFLSSFFK